jgi:hypothetical protein
LTLALASVVVPAAGLDPTLDLDLPTLAEEFAARLGEAVPPSAWRESGPRQRFYPSCMGSLLGLGAKKRRVVKAYGRDSLLIWLNPLLSALQASFGLRVGLRSEAEVLDRMQKDALAMERRGYRVVASDEYELPVFLAPGKRANYYRVTYELSDPSTQ